MKIKDRYKLIAILILSLIVVGGGGMYLHQQYTKLSDGRGDLLFFEDNNFTQPEIIVSPVELTGSKKSSKSSINSNEILPEVGITLYDKLSVSEEHGTTTRYYSGIRAGVGTSAISNNNQHKQFYSSGGSSMLLADGGGRKSAGGLSSSSTGNSSIGVTSAQPSFVPFTGNVNNSQALVDPGVETRMMKITPVGDGLWLLMLLVLGYIGIRRYSK